MKIPHLLLLTLLAMSVSAKLKVFSPTKLSQRFAENNGTIPASYANFGRIPYGASIIGRIYYDTTN